MEVPFTRKRLLSGAQLWVIGVVLVVYSAALVLAARQWDLPSLTGRVFAFLALALAFELLAKVMFAALFRMGLDSVGSTVTWKASILAALAGSAVARLIPAGGALTPSTMAWAVRDEQPDTAGAAVRITMLTYAGLLIMTGLGLAWIATEGPHPVLFAGALILAPVLTIVGIVVMAGAAWLDRLVKRLPRRLAKYLSPTAGGGKVTIMEASLVAIRVVAEAMVLWAAMAAFGIFLTPSEVFVAHGLSMIIGGLPGLPGGLGIVEGGIIGILTAYGLSTTVVVAPVLVYRVVDYWIPAGIGLAAFGVVSRSRVRRQHGLHRVRVDGATLSPLPGLRDETSRPAERPSTPKTPSRSRHG
ncbi:MAG: YbhN family protein [Acidimicrobiia bacterium]|nr:YbhN family protein [Acidimicrobiia bacterium]